MGKVIGVGGVFMTSPDPEALIAWYDRVLGVRLDPKFGTIFPHQASVDTHARGALTVFSIWQSGADYLKPSPFDVMLNLMVDNLDEVLAKAKAEGVETLKPIVEEEYGRFAWILDPDQRKIELWQPKDPGVTS